MKRFNNRTDAGRQLARLLRSYKEKPNAVVLALPRGGVPVGFEIARELEIPLDLIVVRKVGVPGHRELAMGAIATGGIQVHNDEVITELGVAEGEFQRIAEQERQELERREKEYRGERPPPEFSGKTVILVDDGIATGSTLLAAIRAIRSQNPDRIVAAVPVAPSEAADRFRQEVDEFVCVLEPEYLYGVGWWYADFSQTSDADVRSLLERSKHFAARSRYSKHNG